ncbi:Mss4-like protein [Annulohypoxylon truncatum]|uniref:Mss4-like protein n=1 Tax=Annulohypoxylon truncatum TaxID=327061 RepID=UPI0020082D7F|nr:Mss4-like protein [Annulohypoxylon truncatum]KAI1209431.1 Mss4-like protein [Annulohypoxylon truncatum]
MGNFNLDLQHPGPSSQLSAPFPARSADAMSLSDLHIQPEPSTPGWSYAYPEQPSAPRASRVQSIDTGAHPIPMPNFEMGQSTISGIGNAQTDGGFSLFDPYQNLMPVADDLQPHEDPIQQDTEIEKYGCCRCRSVTIRIAGPPIITFICHCTDCKQIFGSDLVSFARYKVEHVDLLIEGQVIYYCVNDVSNFFCAGCGAVFEMRTAGNPTETTIPVALLEDPSHLAPRIEIYCTQRALWLPDYAPPSQRYDHAPQPSTSHMDWQVPDKIW